MAAAKGHRLGFAAFVLAEDRRQPKLPRTSRVLGPDGKPLRPATTERFHWLAVGNKG